MDRFAFGVWNIEVVVNYLTWGFVLSNVKRIQCGLVGIKSASLMEYGAFGVALFKFQQKKPAE